MALRNALPNPLEWPQQLRKLPGDSWEQTLAARLLTLGSMAMTAIAVASLAIFLGIGTAFAESILSFTVDVRYIGEAHVLVSFALAGMIVAVPYAMEIERIAGGREILVNDANWIIGASALMSILAAFQTDPSPEFSPTAAFAFLLIGTLLFVLFAGNVAVNRL